MTEVEIAAAAFGACNALRVVAYAPQLIRIAQDRGDAAAISQASWTTFALSHATTAAYADIVLLDRWMAALFVLNALACAAVVALTAGKRRAHRRRAPAAAARADGLTAR